MTNKIVEITENLYENFTFEDYFDEDGIQVDALRADIAKWHDKELKKVRIEVAERFRKELPVGLFDSTPYLTNLCDKIIKDNEV